MRIADIDAFDNTPILDLKPHIPAIDSPSNAKVSDWWKPAKPREGSVGGGTSRKGSVERIMGFDANGDGKVSKDEMPERMQERLLLRADTNGDGAIDREEVEKLAEQMGQQGGGPGMMGPGGGDRGSFVGRVMSLDRNGDGKVTKDEMPQRMQERMLPRADTNGDGAIDRQEAEKMGGGF